MKAIAQDVYGPAEVLELRDVEQPAIGPDEVLVEVRAAGVDPGVWILMSGRPLAMRLFGFGFRRPKVPVRGRDLAGVVTEVGAAVTRFKPGDEVYGTCLGGSYAEYAAAQEDRLALKPARLTFEEAAVIPVSGLTALRGVRAGEIKPGQRVMVIGASGGVGGFAVQLAKAAGAKVTGVCRTEAAGMVRSMGADDVIDYTREEIDRDGAVYDVVIDTGGDRPLSLLRRALKPRGTLALIGGGYNKGSLLGGMQRQLRAPLAALFSGRRLRPIAGVETRADLAELTGLVESGQVTPVIDGTYALADAPAAIRRLAEGHPMGKIVVTV